MSARPAAAQEARTAGTAEGRPLRALVFGGAGFVGLNVAQHLLGAGDEVLLFDRNAVPEAAQAAFDALPGRWRALRGDVTDAEAVQGAVSPGLDVLVLGAAVTAGTQREADDSAGILQVNVLALPGILQAARAAGVRRVIQLSSAAVYGRAALGAEPVAETTPPQPVGLYGISRLSAEMVALRLGELYGLDVVNLRLSGVFGPWEHRTGVRDTLSPQFQIAEAAHAGRPALLPRAGLRDWIYAPDVARAVAAVARAPALPSRCYNVSAPAAWTVLDWGRHYAAGRPGFACRVVQPGEAPTIDLHAETDRAPLAVARIAADLGWQAQWGCADSARALDAWHGTHDTLWRKNPCD